MQYHRLIRDISTNGLVCTKAELHGFDPTMIKTGEMVAEWTGHVTLVYEEPGIVEDYLANSLNWPVISAQFRRVLDPFVGSEVQWLPVHVRHLDDPTPLAGFYVMNVLQRVPALDLQASVFRTTEIRGQRVIAGVDRYVLRSDLLRWKNIVRLTEPRVTLVVSDLVKDAIQRAGVSGCVCRPVQMS